MDWLPIKPTVIQVDHSFLCILLTSKLDIHVPHQVVSQVVTDIHLLNLSVLFFHLGEDFLEELIIVLLHLHIAHSTAQTVSRLGRVLRVTVNVQEGNGLAKGRFIVQPRTSVSMTTCSNFEIK